MFSKLGHLMYRRRWYVVGLWIVILIAVFPLALRVGDVLGPGDFVLKGSDSQKAAVLLDTKFHQNDQNVLLVLVQNRSLSTSSPRFKAAAADVANTAQRFRPLHITYVDNPLKTHNTQLIGRDGHSVALLLSSSLKEQDIESKVDRLRQMVKQKGFTTWITGTPALNHDYAVESQKDLARGDAITGPILIIILLAVFGTLVASSIPFLLAICAIVLSLAVVFIFGHFLSASIYVENVVQVLGLGIAIDYSLFIVYRFREEIAVAHGDVERAVVRTMETTGRAVFFSGITVAIGLSSLILTNLSFLESMGLGGMLVPLSSLAVAMTLLPAVLGLLGERINTPLVRRGLEKITGHAAWVDRLPRRRFDSTRPGLWHQLATTIMRRPWISGGAALVLLLAIGFPVTQMKFAYGGLKNADQSVQSVAAYLYMRNHLPSTPDPTVVLISRNTAGRVLTPHTVAGIRALESQLRRDHEVLKVVGPADFIPSSGAPTAAQRAQLFKQYVSTDRGTAMISVVPRHEVGTGSNESMVRRIRDRAATVSTGTLAGNEVRVGGASANYIDFNDAMYSKFPFIVALVLILTYAFLFFAFRSIFLPLKAVLLNLLSVGAAYGALQLVFVKGAFHQPLGFTPEDGVAPWVPVFLFAFLFGLSMDYEVFLLSRIREHWLRTSNNRASVAYGLEKTGKLITYAAAIMVVAFSGFQVGHEIQLREFGFGLMASIAIDATLIRIVLVPAIMEIMGDLNWWVPSRLRAWSMRGMPAEEDATPTEEPEPATV